MKGIWDEILGQEAKAKHKPNTSESEVGIDKILRMRLSELARRDIALKIYSEVLGCAIWLCSNERMELEIKQDDPEAVTYTVYEMRKLIRMNHDPQSLRSIHKVKTVFPASKIIKNHREKDIPDSQG